MTQPPRFGLIDLLLFLLVLGAAGGTRAAYLHFCAADGHAVGPVLVQGEISDEQKMLIANVKEHGWFGCLAPLARAEEQTAHTEPGYPWLLGLLARLPVELELVVRWAQCGLGALTAGMYFLFARRAFRSTLVGGLAGLLCACHPFWVANTAEINDGTLAGFLLAACLCLGARAGQERGPFTSLLYGLALAGAALVRAAWLPFAFAGLLWFLLRCRKLPRGWFLALLAFLGFANGLAPWTIRNFQVVGDVVPIVDSAYLHLWMGNNPQATGGEMSEPALVDALSRLRHQEPHAVAARLEQLKQRDRYAELAGAAAEEVSRDPLGTLQRRIWAGLYFFLGQDWFTEQGKVCRPASTSAAGSPSWVADEAPLILTATLLGMLLLGVIGWRWTYGWRRESMPAALAVLLLPLPYLLSHAEVLHGPRLPLDGVLLCYAAFTLACLVPGVGGTLLAGGDK
jgi:Dolichyl-phosphate-mannose-protein mannosyltransferase